MFTFQETNNYSQITWRENVDCCYQKAKPVELCLHICPYFLMPFKHFCLVPERHLQACTCRLQSTEILVIQKVQILEFMRPGKGEELVTQEFIGAACPWRRKNPVQLATQQKTLSLPSYHLSRNSRGRRQTPYPCIKCHVQPCWLLVWHYQIINSMERIFGATYIS